LFKIQFEKHDKISRRGLKFRGGKDRANSSESGGSELRVF